MKVKVMNRIWEMGLNEYRQVRQLASEQVPFGIYAVEKKGYAELVNIRCDSITQLKKYRRDFNKSGFVVRYNT